MYYLAKIVWFFLEPSNLLIFAALAGVILASRLGRRLALAAVLLLIAAGFSPVGTLLLRPLEQRFPAFPADGPVTGAIVLGGALTPDVTAARRQMNLNEAGERIVAVLDLARRHPEARLVFTGGSGDLVGGVPEADALAAELARLAPELRLTYERASRNTVENAEMTRALVDPKPGERWLLVTSAWHMPRAVGIFRRAGWNVVAYPVDYRTTGTIEDLRPFPSLSNGLRRTDLAVKEWIGILFAYLTGKSASLLPGP